MNNRYLIILAVLFFSYASEAQCLQGDCKNGKGKFDFGYAVYEGEFNNGVPHGRGILDYGKGEKYDGEFKAGKEDGRGLYIKDGQVKGVVYKEGQLVKRDEVIAVGARPQLDGCQSGDCENGFGIAVFESGNRYEGSFSHFRFHGQGKMTFASGNVLEGLFEGNKPIKGTFTYAKEKIVFTGTFHEDGTPNSGTYSYPENESTVTVVNNQITAVHNPKAEAARKKLEEAINRKPEPCPQCEGKKIVTTTTKHSYTTGGTYYNSQYNHHHVWITEPQTVTRTSKSYDVCSKCGGKGVLQ